MRRIENNDGGVNWPIDPSKKIDRKTPSVKKASQHLDKHVYKEKGDSFTLSNQAKEAIKRHNNRK